MDSFRQTLSTNFDTWQVRMVVWSADCRWCISFPDSQDSQLPLVWIASYSHQLRDKWDLKGVQLFSVERLFDSTEEWVVVAHAVSRFQMESWKIFITLFLVLIKEMNWTHVPSNRFSSKSKTRSFRKLPIVVGIFLSKLFERMRISSCCKHWISSGSFVIEFVPRLSSTIFVHCPMSSGNWD